MMGGATQCGRPCDEYLPALIITEHRSGGCHIKLCMERHCSSRYLLVDALLWVEGITNGAGPFISSLFDHYYYHKQRHALSPPPLDRGLA